MLHEEVPLRDCNPVHYNALDPGMVPEVPPRGPARIDT
jgi:hypothetical protein